MLQHDDDDHEMFPSDPRQALQASLIDPPPTPPPPQEFFECSTPKMNNCKRNTQRQLELLRMLDDDCACPRLPTTTLSSFPEFKRSAGTARSLRVLASSAPPLMRTRSTPVSCPLDEDPIPKMLKRHPSYSHDLDDSEPPALPMRRNGLCPSNMPASIMVQLVIGR